MIGKLTTLESAALRSGLNVSDGHPRMPLTQSQRTIIAGLGELFEEALKRPFEELAEETHRAFLHGLGQHSAPLGTGRLLSCYSSSVAIDIVARALAERTAGVALIHPTFDNIPDLLKARRLRLVPIPEQAFLDGPPDLAEEIGAVFVTTPNNPTGWVLGEQPLAGLASWCARTGRVLVLDTSFRGQDTRAQYDSYRVLIESGAEWAVIEDTGKLWPVLELKAGFLSWGQHTALSLADGFDDLLLSVSPLVMLLLNRLAQDATLGGYQALHQLIAGNRAILAGALAGRQLTMKEPQSRISVAQVSLPAASGSGALYQALLARGVHVLPCRAFHWADPQAGAHDIRIALARAPWEVRTAATVLAEVANDPAEPSAKAPDPHP
jgi:enduracididine biosynthesis enzyme MppP